MFLSIYLTLSVFLVNCLYFVVIVLSGRDKVLVSNKRIRIGLRIFTDKNRFFITLSILSIKSHLDTVDPLL